MAKRTPDPRVTKLNPTVNEQVVNRTIRHATYLEYVKNSEVKQVVTLLNRDVVPALMKQTEQRLEKIAARGFDSGPWTTKRLKELTEANTTLLRAGLSKVATKTEKSLTQVALSEAEWVKGTISKSLPIEVDVRIPNVETLRAIVSSKPMQGKVLDKWFTDLAPVTAQHVTRSIQTGIGAGETIDQIVRRLKADTTTFAKAFGGDSPVATLNRNARAVVRTAVNHTTTRAKEASYRANKDVVKGVRIVATLDSRTTEICMGQDGKVYPVDEGPRPPFHFQCRTTTAPVVKSWKEMGIKVPEGKKGDEVRASINGEVSARETYGTWLKKQPVAFQNRVLGKSKAELFRQGRVGVEDFSSLTRGSKFQTLTISEVELLESMDEFIAVAAGMSEIEKVNEVTRLISVLNTTDDESSRRVIRAKLRVLDENWTSNYDRRTGEKFRRK